MTKTSTHAFSTSRKHTTRFLVKSFGRCCRSTSVTGCQTVTGRQVTVFLLRSFCPCRRSSQPFTIGFGHRQGCSVTTRLHGLIYIRLTVTCQSMMLLLGAAGSAVYFLQVASSDTDWKNIISGASDRDNIFAKWSPCDTSQQSPQPFQFRKVQNVEPLLLRIGKSQLWGFSYVSRKMFLNLFKTWTILRLV